MSHNPFGEIGLVGGGFFAFVENGHLIADKDLLAMFGLNGLRMVDCTDLIGEPRLPQRSGIPIQPVLETDRWKMVGDDFYYQLYRRPETRHVLRELSKTHGMVFMFMIGGDAASFHEFRLLRDGEVVREYVTNAVPFSIKPHTVVIDSGDRLEGERDEAPSDYELSNYPFSIAARLGFDIADGLALSPRVWGGGTDPREVNRSNFPHPEAWF